MAISRTLKRLLRVLVLEEEQLQGALEEALSEFRRIESMIEAAIVRRREARLLIHDSILTGCYEDRIAGTEEESVSERLQELLKPWLAQTEAIVNERRVVYMAKRTERRQAETLLEEAEKREAVERVRKDQISLDEWYLSRKLVADSESKAKARRLLASTRPSIDESR